MSKDTKTPRTYTTKVIAKALAPYVVILVLGATFAGVVAGWTMRSDFDGTIRQEVAAQYAELKKADK